MPTFFSKFNHLRKKSDSYRMKFNFYIILVSNVSIIADNCSDNCNSSLHLMIACIYDFLRNYTN